MKFPAITPYILIAFILIGQSVPTLAQSNSDQVNARSDVAKRPLSREAIKLYNEAVDFQQNGYPREAEIKYEAALAVDDRLDAGWSNLGGLYASKKMYYRAMEAYRKALDLNPRKTMTLNAYASALFAVGKVDKAIAMWRQTIEIDPTYTLAVDNLTNALARSASHDQAEEPIQKH